MMEAYIELLLACFVAFKMFDIRPVWNNWDKFAVIVHFIGIALTVSFFLFVCYFVFVHVKPYAIKK